MENKKAERRQADRKRQAQSASGESPSQQRVTTTALKRVPPTASAFDTCRYHHGSALLQLDQLADDELPSDSVETGLIYMSRWGHESATHDDATSDRTKNDASKARLEDKGAAHGRLKAQDVDGDKANDGVARASRMQAQQKCSLALLNMTMRDQVL